jgi:branched-chain amino acid transport system substrate-binding protein
MTRRIKRRTFVKTAAAAAASSVLVPRFALGAEPINVGSLTPNTGGGGPFGPKITAAHKKVTEIVNAEGGVLGREVALYQENSETNPETAIRAARKLVDVNKVIGILGTWSSSVTLGIMPLCQEAGVIQMCTSSSADIPIQDKEGLVFNFQALSPVWGGAIASLALRRGFKSYSVMALNNDFTKSMVDTFVEQVKADGADVLTEPFYYNGNQSSYRSEVGQLIDGDPEAIFIPSYVTDFTAVYKEIFRAGYEGQVITVSISTGSKFKDAVGEAANGILHGLPVPPIDSDAYKSYLALMGLEDTGGVQHPFGTAGHDQMSVLLLAVESAGTDDVNEVKKHIRRVANPDGERATNVIEGLQLLRAGKEINYSGASSEVDFAADTGSLKSREFNLWEIKDGTDVLIENIKS